MTVASPGFGVIRACLEGLKIGPLYAETERIAEELLIALAATARGDTIYLDVPAPNTAAIRLAERHGMKPIFETARMYTGAGARSAAVAAVRRNELRVGLVLIVIATTRANRPRSLRRFAKIIVIASEAKQSRASCDAPDCSVGPSGLLAMTN